MRESDRCAFMYSPGHGNWGRYPAQPCPYPKEWHNGTHGRHAFQSPPEEPGDVERALEEELNP